MASNSLTKPAAVALGCAGLAVAAPFLAPYLATISLPFFGAVLAGVFKAEEFTDGFGKVIVNTAAGFLTEIGGSAIDKLPGALSSEHNYHLEKMLATAYLESLEAIEKEIAATGDAATKEQAAQIIPLVKARIKRGLKKEEISLLFPLQAAYQPSATAYANRFSAESVTLLIGDEERWREELGREVEIALRRWLNEEQAEKERAARQIQLGLATTDERLPEPLHTHLRAALPHMIAHRISELVKSGEFKESWIAFQRAHLQGISRVVGRIETSQVDIRRSIAALAQRIEGFADEKELVEALAKMQGEYLSKLSSSHDELARLLERQSEEWRGIEQRLSAQMAQSTERLSDEGKENTALLSAESKENTAQLSAEGKENAAQVVEIVEEVGAKGDENTGKVLVTIAQTKEELKEIMEGAQRAARNRLKQLPAPPRDFTGREAELDELRQALRRGGATISGVQGMGGVGKTALALVLAEEFKGDYPDAQIYLDLKGVSSQSLSPAEVMWHVVSSFHPDMKQPDDGELPAWYNALLNEKRVLLLYDNAKDAAQIEPLLPPAHCLLLVTSRKHFKVPGMFDKDLDEMTGADAAALLLEIAPRIAGDAGAIAEQCGYLPLALRLAASALNKSHALSPSDLLRRLRDKRRRVELVEASFSLSYELLSEEQRQRWRTLALFPTVFDATAAAAVWETDVDAAKDSLAELEEYSLLDWEEAARRFSLHDLARDYADTRLSETERERAGSLHAAYYLQILSTATDLYEKGGAAIAEGLTLFDSERVNIEAGQEWAAARFAGDERAARLCNEYPGAGVYVLNLRQHPRDFIRWHESALAAARQLKDRAAEGRHLGNLGYAYDDLGEYRRAIEFYEQHRDIARKIGDRRGEGNALGNLGIAYKNLGETRRAIEFHEQNLDIAREIGDRRGEGNALFNTGLALDELGDRAQALAHAEAALEIYEQIESPAAARVRAQLAEWRGGAE